jgi:predicted lysophospholipase L1 biosynthesis ABC-type transport system permease subunit
VAALSVFIALWNAVRERRADLAMLRMLGAPPGRVAGLVLCEALWLALLASALGLLLGHGAGNGCRGRPGCRWQPWAWPCLRRCCPPSAPTGSMWPDC